jgi:hypothetical protein
MNGLGFGGNEALLGDVMQDISLVVDLARVNWASTTWLAGRRGASPHVVDIPNSGAPVTM